MKITRMSPFSRKKVTMDLPITAEQYAAWESGTLAQNAFPRLTPDQREFIMTGITPEEWAEAFPEE
jgi:hypothetical protein